MKLHLNHDDVFLDYVINACRELGQINDHKFIVYPNDDSGTVSSVRSPEAIKCQFGSDEFKNAVGDWNRYDSIFLHGLFPKNQSIVKEIPHDIPLIWCFWGGDGFKGKDFSDFLFQPFTSRYVTFNRIIEPFFTVSFSKLRRHAANIIKYDPAMKKEFHEAVHRVNYFAHYLKEDLDIITARTGGDPEFIPFHYGCAEDIYDFSKQHKIPEGRYLMLGNSDTPSNNHLDALRILKENDLDDFEVYCPLSYWGEKYARDIKTEGSKILGDRFRPILDYLPLEKYIELISDAPVAVMNHNRSQALGNIMVYLCNGTRLYMCNKSTLYHYLKDNGVYVNSFQEHFRNDNRNKLNPLSDDEVSTNRELMLKLFGRSSYKNKLSYLLSL